MITTEASLVILVASSLCPLSCCLAGNLARLIGLPLVLFDWRILGALIVLSFIYGVPTFGVTFSIFEMTAE